MQAENEQKQNNDTPEKTNTSAETGNRSATENQPKTQQDKTAANPLRGKENNQQNSDLGIP